MLDGMGRGEPQDGGAGMSAPLFALCIGAAMILFVLGMFAILRRPSIEDSHEFGNASDLAPAKPDWLDRARKAGL